MIVVLDTNIYLSDPGLNSQRLTVLEQYATKTSSSFAMPRIVLEELLSKRRRTIEEADMKVKSLLKSLNNHLLLTQLPDFSISLDDEVAAYKTELFERFYFEDEMVVEYGPDYLTNVLNRAINRIPPCSPKGEEIRDAVLWLTLLDIANTDEEKTVLFISGDRSAFADSPDVLKPELAKECKERGVNVRYFTSLPNFAEALAVKLDFINEEWIQHSISLEEVVGKAEAAIEEAADAMLGLTTHTRERNRESTGYFNQLSNNITLDHYFVNELADSRFRIEAVYSGEVEVECEITGEKEIEGRSGRWTYNAILDDMEFEEGEPTKWRRFSEMVYVYPYVTITVEILVHEENVLSWNVIDLDT